MAKKDFAAINTGKADTGVNTGEVFTIAEQGSGETRAIIRKGRPGTYTPQAEASADEKQQRAAQLKTQGRKGCKMERMNMAFTPDNYEFIAVVSKVTGKTMTAFVNSIIAEYREANPDIYEKAKAVIDLVNKE